MRPPPRLGVRAGGAAEPISCAPSPPPPHAHSCEPPQSAFHTDWQGPGCPGCRMADGFYKSYLALAPAVKVALNGIGAGTVVITGHSLGAGMAGIAMLDLHTSGFNLASTHYTFGHPRDGERTAARARRLAPSLCPVPALLRRPSAAPTLQCARAGTRSALRPACPSAGDNTYASTFNSVLGSSRLFRVVHYKDIVPHLPFEWMGFHHSPREVWFNEAQTSYQVCDGTGEDPNCSDSLTIAASISDHLDYLNLPISNMC